MAASIFGEKTNIPNNEALHSALKDSHALWDTILDFSDGKGEWKFYGKAAGWTFQVKKSKRTLFYMMPKDAFFQITFVYGEHAVEAAKSAGLPEQVLTDLLQAKVYVEGRSVSIAITSIADIDIVKKMLQLKLE